MTPQDTLPAYGIDVSTTGAHGDGVADDAAAIQKALDAGAGLVSVPAGVYKIGSTLRVGANTHLAVHPQAKLFLADGAGVDDTIFLLAGRGPDANDGNIRVTGGIWDGNNANNTRGPDSPGSYTGVLVNFIGVEDLTLSGLHVRNPVSYHIRLDRVKRFRVEKIRFEKTVVRPNQDGVHLGGHCEDGVIQHLAAYGARTPNDDLVALNADDANERAQNLGKTCGPIRRVRVRDIAAEDCHSFVRFLTVDSPIEDIDIEDVRGGCSVCAVNADGGRHCAVKVFDPADPAYARGTGWIRNVRIRNMNVYRATCGHGNPLIDMWSRTENMEIIDFRRDLSRDAAPDLPTFRAEEMPSTAFTIEGICPCDREEMKTVAEAHKGHLQPMADPAGAHRYRAEFAIGLEDKLTLGLRAFSRMRVDTGKS